jgi:hypothetical protein
VLRAGNRRRLRERHIAPGSARTSHPHVNPLGVKGIGEITIIGVAPAIVNAIYHATGRRIRELPVTPDKLLQALTGSHWPCAAFSDLTPVRLPLNGPV